MSHDICNLCFEGKRDRDGEKKRWKIDRQCRKRSAHKLSKAEAKIVIKRNELLKENERSNNRSKTKTTFFGLKEK